MIEEVLHHILKVKTRCWCEKGMRPRGVWGRL